MADEHVEVCITVMIGSREMQLSYEGFTADWCEKGESLTGEDLALSLMYSLEQTIERALGPPAP